MEGVRGGENRLLFPRRVQPHISHMRTARMPQHSMTMGRTAPCQTHLDEKVSKTERMVSIGRVEAAHRVPEVGLLVLGTCRRVDLRRNGARNGEPMWCREAGEWLEDGLERLGS